MYNDDDPKVIEYNRKKYGAQLQEEQSNPFFSNSNPFSSGPNNHRLKIGTIHSGKNSGQMFDQKITPRMEEVPIDPTLMMRQISGSSFPDFMNSDEIENLS